MFLKPRKRGVINSDQSTAYLYQGLNTENLEIYVFLGNISLRS